MSIEQRKLWSISPSAVDSYRKCARVWFNSYILKDRGPIPQFLARGTSIHYGIEHYLKTGEVLVEHENADAPGVKWPILQFTQAAIGHLPKPIIDSYWDPWREKGDGGLMIEQAGPMGTYTEPDGTAGPNWVQYIDLIEVYPDRAIITDTKSTSDFRYCKTPDELAHNVQLIANAVWLFLESDYREITLRHLYLLTKGKRPKANPVSVTITREHAMSEWQKILATVREMAAWAKLGPETADPLPPTLDHCGSYGGCVYRSKCGFDAGTGLVRLSGHKGETNMGTLLSKMLETAGKMAGTAPAAPAQVTTITPVTSPTVVGTVAPAAGGSALLGKLSTPQAVGTIIPAQAAPAPAHKPGSLAALLAGKAVAPTAAAPALTPESAQAAAVAAGYPLEAPTPVGLSPAPQLAAAMIAVATAPAPEPEPIILRAGDQPGYDPNGIVPPDAPISTSTPAEVAAANGEKFTTVRQISEFDSQKDVVDWIKASAPNETRTVIFPTAEGSIAPAGDAPAPAPRKGRPPGSRNKKTEAPATVTGVVTVVGPSAPGTFQVVTTTSETLPGVTVSLPMPDVHVEVVATDTNDELAKVRAILNAPDRAFECAVEALFIDCMPGKGWPGEQPSDLANHMHAFNGLAASSAGVADYRLIPYSAKGYLATAIRVYMRALPKAVYVDSAAPGADVFIETVVPYCRMIFRGVR